jgi:hypothetical protein
MYVSRRSACDGPSPYASFILCLCGLGNWTNNVNCVVVWRPFSRLLTEFASSMQWMQRRHCAESAIINMQSILQRQVEELYLQRDAKTVEVKSCSLCNRLGNYSVKICPKILFHFLTFMCVYEWWTEHWRIRMYWHILIFIDLYWHILTVLTYIDMYWRVLTCVYMYWHY